MTVPRLRWLFAAAGLCVLVTIVAVPLRFRLVPVAEVDGEQAEAALAFLRAQLVAGEPLPLPEELRLEGNDPLPMVLTLWVSGRRADVWQVDDLPPAEALGALSEALLRDAGEVDPELARLQLDMAVASGWLPRSGVAFALSFVEGRDGAAGRLGSRWVYLPPAELVRGRAFETYRPAGKLERGLTVGAEPAHVEKLLRLQARELGLEDVDVDEIRRFRAVTVVEGSDLRPRRLLKATVERPPLTRARLEASVRAGADYLRRSQRRHGRFRYIDEPTAGRESPHYHWRRHFGVCFGLALVGHILGRPEIVDSADRGLRELDRRLVPGPEGTLYPRRSAGARLGDVGVALLAVVTHREASGDARRDEAAASLARLALAMQRPDGTFHLDWNEEAGFHTERMRPYEVGEALYGLAAYGRVYGDEEALDAASRGMDHLAGPYWDHFLGRFFVGQEHWTCLAAEELYRTRPRAEHARFCHQIGNAYAALALDRDGTPFPEDAGGVGFAHVMSPHLGATATVVEAIVSAVVLGEAEGLETDGLREQLETSLAYLEGGQISRHDTFWIARPARALGGFYDSRSRPHMRMDNIQHAITGMARALALYPETRRGEPGRPLAEHRP